MKLRAIARSLAFISLVSSSSVISSPWIGTQDKQLHYDLQTLVEWGYIDLAVTSYPVPWKGLEQELRQIDISSLPFPARQAGKRLLHYLRLQERLKLRQFLELQGATDDIRFRGLDDGVEDTGKITLSSEFYSGRLSGQLSLNYASGGAFNLDESFLAYQFGGWNLRVGAIEQFWGPAQSSSLVLSNNARPIPAIALSRSSATASKSRWLSWLGPWYFTTQMGQLRGEREIKGTRLFLNRFNSRPFDGFELGVSWTAMWGGDGQPDDFGAFVDVLTFQTECQLAGGVCTDDQLTRSGNHIAGFDFSYTAQLFSRPITLYAQRIGGDSSGDFNISDNADLFGISTYIDNAKVFIETSDTNVNCSGALTDSLNCFYENAVYRSGYRLYGRAIGSTFDSDAKQVTLGVNYRFENGSVAEVFVRNVELNQDGQLPSPVLTDGPTEDLLELSGTYQSVFNDWLLKTGASLAKRDLPDGDETQTILYLKAQYAF